MDKETEVADYIDECWRRNFAPPSMRQVVENTSVSSTSVVDRIYETLCKDYGYTRPGMHSGMVPPWVREAIHKYGGKGSE